MTSTNPVSYQLEAPRYKAAPGEAAIGRSVFLGPVCGRLNRDLCWFSVFRKRERKVCVEAEGVRAGRPEIKRIKLGRKK